MTAIAAPGSAALLLSQRRAVRNSRIRAVIYLGVAALLAFIAFRLPVATMTKFVLNLAKSEALPLPTIVVPSGGMALVAALAMVAASGVELRLWRTLRWRLLLAAVSPVLVFAILTLLLINKEASLVGILQSAVQLSIPVAFGGLAGLVCEKSGVFNIAIEGQLLGSACAAAMIGAVFHNAWIGLLGGIGAGALLGLLLAVLSIRYNVDQIIGGVVINIGALGATTFIYNRLLTPSPELNAPGELAAFSVPLLSRIPILGPAAFSGPVVLFLLYIVIGVLYLAINRTRWGLRLRASGEYPQAAGTVGIDVLKIRYRAVMLGGAIAGLGGAYLSIGLTGSFQINMSAGRGFIGLAAMIFGGWNPIGVGGASLVFGFADAVQARLSILNVPIPSVILVIMPYLITIAVVAGVVGRVRGPASSGQPYEQD